MLKSITVALAGNPNSGKTTLFNAFTGARHSVGNWAGVTVEKKEGEIKHNNNKINIVDLPGTYSLSPYSLEEVVARNYIVDESPDVVVNIIDASNIERNLYLSTQLMELGKPVVIALNMMDVAEKKGHKIDSKKLSELLGVPIVPIIAAQKKGIQELLDTIIDVAEGKIICTPSDVDYGKEIEVKIKKTMEVLKDNIYAHKFNQRWLALKVLEEDESILKTIKHDLNNVQSQEQIVATSEIVLDNDFESVIVDKKYTHIGKIISKAVKRPIVVGLTTSDKVDKILINRWLGLPIFAAIMYMIFGFTFNIGNIFLDLIDGGFASLAELVGESLEAVGTATWLNSLLVDGIISGIGGVLTFVPNIAFLFIALGILEDSGYMARVAFIMDRAMRKVGLSGKAFIPMLMGFGCSVPAIMGTRTLEEESDRLTTILVTPFMSCGARLPIYILFAGVFFPGKEGVVVYSLYMLGILVAVLAALTFKKTLFKGEEVPFIMELPPYRMPTVRGTGLHVWEKVKGYIVKAGTVIFAASLIIWFVLGFNLSGVAEMPQSIGASIGKVFAPIFTPLGFGNWQATLALITGLLAKEAVVSSMAVIYGLGEAVGEVAVEGDVVGFISTLKTAGFTQLSAYAFMVFTLLYTPCIAVVGVIKRETNSWKWAGFSMVYQFVVAWIVALIVYQVGGLLGF